MFFEDTEAEVMLRDGSWVWCQVIGQRKDRYGRWCVGIRYYPNATIGWYLYDPQRIRRAADLKSQQLVSCSHIAAAFATPVIRQLMHMSAK